MATIKERADTVIYYPEDGHPLRSCEVIAFASGYEKGATEQKAVDIETIPQLYVRWLMIDGDKPSWSEYANKALEE